MSGFTSSDLISVLNRVCGTFEDSKAQLNELDSQLGDGDLGSTLSAIAAALKPKLGEFPEDIGVCFGEVAKVIGATSGSSFSAITMFGLLHLSRTTNGKTVVAWDELPQLLDDIIQEMSAKGGAQKGDKTVIDGLAAIGERIRGNPDNNDIAQLAKIAMEDTLNQFKDRPSKIGRARIAGERQTGFHDPGMYALYLAVDAI